MDILNQDQQGASEKTTLYAAADWPTSEIEISFEIIYQYNQLLAAIMIRSRKRNRLEFMNFSSDMFYSLFESWKEIVGLVMHDCNLSSNPMYTNHFITV
jgi:hypothetical protein